MSAVATSERRLLGSGKRGATVTEGRDISDRTGAEERVRTAAECRQHIKAQTSPQYPEGEAPWAWAENSRRGNLCRGLPQGHSPEEKEKYVVPTNSARDD